MGLFGEFGGWYRLPRAHRLGGGVHDGFQTTWPVRKYPRGVGLLGRTTATPYRRMTRSPSNTVRRRSDTSTDILIPDGSLRLPASDHRSSGTAGASISGARNQRRRSPSISVFTDSANTIASVLPRSRIARDATMCPELAQRPTRYGRSRGVRSA